MSRGARPTLETVARAAGVHRSTAARALNPQTRALISDAVVARIQAEAFKLGYRMNTAAATLRTGRSHLIGVVLPDLDNPIFGPILQALEDTLSTQGYLLVIANGGMDRDRQAAAAEGLLDRHVDGLVLATAWREDPLVERCVARGTPLVLLNRAEDVDRAPSVLADEAAGMGLAVDHLVALGHERIGLLGGPEDVSTGRRRAEGFRAAMRTHGLDPFAVASAGFYSTGAGQAAAEELFGRFDVTAVVAANDLLAIGALGALPSRGLNCPRDVSLIGYNDMPLADMLAPPLTTVAMPKRELGRLAAEQVLALVGGEAPTPLRIQISCSLVVRGSTAPPSR